MLKGALFDFTGTLFHNEQMHQQIVRELFGTAHTGVIDEDELRAHSGLPYRDRFEHMLAMRGVDDDTLVAKLEKQANNLQTKRSDPKSLLVPGVAAWIKTLHQAGLQLGVVSSADSQYIKDQLAAVKLGHYFSVIIGCDSVAATKPHPEPYHTALQQLDLAAIDCVAFEDSPAGVEAACLAKLSVVGLLTNYPAADLTHTIHTMHDYQGLTLQQLEHWL